ncbi:MAG: hypothetical protein R3307_04755 [Anaerolineales bacterium]|nr:hypothetical protein [Anaerolineales bacterium]
MQNNFVDVEKRVKRYWYEDGIAEISVGLLFTVLGAFFGVQGYYGEGSKVAVILQMSMVLVMLGSIFGTQWMVKTLKSNLTYPRTGYVEYRAKDKGMTQRRLIVVIVALVVAVASFVLVSFFREVDSMVLVSSILVGAIFILLRGRSSGVTRFYYFYFGGLSFALGIGLSLGSLPRLYSLGLFYGVFGFVILISGTLVLRQYLQKNPMPMENDHE